VTHQDFPGKEYKMPIQAQYDTLPTDDGGYQTYRPAGKLEGKKAIITGGDSGIGRATAILFAMEGADSFIAYLPDEEKDAQETKKLVESHGRQCHLHATDLTSQDNCKKLVDEAVKAMGRVNILFNNAAYQMMVNEIKDLSE
jgi:NAD(P)-dependent dehydrogenase (short-subunit alcohol dehydrogenase family)